MNSLKKISIILIGVICIFCSSCFTSDHNPQWLKKRDFNSYSKLLTSYFKKLGATPDIIEHELPSHFNAFENAQKAFSDKNIEILYSTDPVTMRGSSEVFSTFNVIGVKEKEKTKLYYCSVSHDDTHTLPPLLLSFKDYEISVQNIQQELPLLLDKMLPFELQTQILYYFAFKEINDKSSVRDLKFRLSNFSNENNKGLIINILASILEEPNLTSKDSLNVYAHLAQQFEVHTPEHSKYNSLAFQAGKRIFEKDSGNINGFKEYLRQLSASNDTTSFTQYSQLFYDKYNQDPNALIFLASLNKVQYDFFSPIGVKYLMEAYDKKEDLTVLGEILFSKRNIADKSMILKYETEVLTKYKDSLTLCSGSQDKYCLTYEGLGGTGTYTVPIQKK
ncbi:hypothetical protein R9C00_08325 [Flammeovirgaceae bacterium SG7u.111]|nr:hypothetical protein [Flammeovirgaceae bacterium SG7u.132]WPO37452.1 hypothetical protein R9C00_08325 [Flammeovirgaceae bacterium SG7u.111]